MSEEEEEGGSLTSQSVLKGKAMALYDPKLCFLLDGFLVVYGLVITGMFIKEKFFRTKGKLVEDALYTVSHRAPLPRQKKNEQVYQGLSSATRDTYDSLQMQPLPAR
uniref:T-cell surface glycoprotein CD3 zeta chain n=1 Tax=Scophthalmus maximus TaxID=52904 RepID=A0A8D2ZCK7_SCOMX